jgi:hypothetical protein
MKLKFPSRILHEEEIPYDHNANKPEPKKILYHYTTQDGYIGISSSRKIWATNIHYLNDFHEVKHASDLARILFFHKINEIKFKQLACYKELFDNILSSVSKIPLFITSFTEEGDLLSQWRGYCPDGPGFSLGFSKETLDKVSKEQNLKLLPCIYEKEHQEFILIEKVDQLIAELVRSHNQKTNSNTIIDLIQEWAGEFLEIAPTLKHPSFKEEKEWRFISELIGKNENKFKIRKGRYSLIPYIEIDLNCASSEVIFENIICGPTPFHEMSTNALYFSSETDSIKFTSKTQSRIPYRNW